MYELCYSRLFYIEFGQADEENYVFVLNHKIAVLLIWIGANWIYVTYNLSSRQLQETRASKRIQEANVNLLNKENVTYL